jgi:hypothetical protein
MKEFEKKMLLSEQEYNCLMDMFKDIVSESFEQTNYYYDTRLGTMRKQNTTVRIRKTTEIMPKTREALVFFIGVLRDLGCFMNGKIPFGVYDAEDCPFEAGGAVIGRVTMKVLPSPSWLSTLTDPPHR